MTNWQKTNGLFIDISVKKGFIICRFLVFINFIYRFENRLKTTL